MMKPLDLIYQEALTKASFAQTWPGHFLVKKIETEIILKYFNQKKIKKGLGLEIGCGNAFQSALIASFANKFVATDLFTNDDSTHTVGMAKAKKLVQGYDKIPSEDYSSERMGGWLIRDTDDMLIGWVGNLGEITVYDYKPTTKENANAKNFRGVK